MITLEAIRNSAFLNTTVGQLFTAREDRSDTFKKVVSTVKMIAMFAFNCYASWGQPTIYAISFVLGATLFHDAVTPHITQRIAHISAAAFGGIYLVMHARELPAILLMQAVLFGADLGRRTIDFFTPAPQPA